MTRKEMKRQEVIKALHLLGAYRDIVEGMVMPMKDNLDDYFKNTTGLEKRYFYAHVKASTDFAKKIHFRFKKRENVALEIWQQDNEKFANHLKALQKQLARMGYGVNLDDIVKKEDKHKVD